MSKTNQTKAMNEFKMTDDYKAARNCKLYFEEAADEREKALKKARAGAFRMHNLKEIKGGLTPDIVKFDKRVQYAKRGLEQAMAELRQFNAVFVKNHKREYRRHRESMMASK